MPDAFSNSFAEDILTTIDQIPVDLQALADCWQLIIDHAKLGLVYTKELDDLVAASQALQVTCSRARSSWFIFHMINNEIDDQTIAELDPLYDQTVDMSDKIYALASLPNLNLAILRPEVSAAIQAMIDRIRFFVTQHGH